MKGCSTNFSCDADTKERILNPIQQDNPNLIGKTWAEIQAIEAQSSRDDYDPQTDWDSLVQAAKVRQAQSDAQFAANPSQTLPASDGLAVVIARLEVLTRQANAH